ncbi:MAG: hypothetical protein JSS20_10000 [Proteobacteria bacterium]|nr:hypothetical protein [Pseudomonadota bacterium]
MHGQRLKVIAIGLALIVGGATSAMAQSVTSTFQNNGRICQTLRTCNFSRHAEVRGCLSSYTCRTCRTVRTRCDLGAGYTNCTRVVCSWGG